MWLFKRRKSEVVVRIYVMHSSGKMLEYLPIYQLSIYFL